MVCDVDLCSCLVWDFPFLGCGAVLSVTYLRVGLVYCELCVGFRGFVLYEMRFLFCAGLVFSAF